MGPDISEDPDAFNISVEDHHQEVIMYPNNGHSKILWDVSTFLPDYRASLPREQKSSVITLLQICVRHLQYS